MNTALMESNPRATTIAAIEGQYSLAKILGIWASVALPMGLIRWVVTPILIPRVDMEPGFLYLILINLALVWQGVSSKWLYLWTIPLIALVNLGYTTLGWLNEPWVRAFPFLAPPAHMEIQSLAEPAVGQWWLIGVLAVQIVFNFLLGEGLIFHGILLPKMNSVFGKWDVIANHILFMTYHLHKIEVWPQILIINWIWPWAVKRFKSYWMVVILHGSDAPYLIVVFVMAIMGLMQ